MQIKMLYLVAFSLAILVEASSGSIIDCCGQGERAGRKDGDGPVCIEKNIDYAAAGRVSRNMCRNVFISCCRNSAEELYCTAGVQAAINNHRCEAGTQVGGGMKQICCDCCAKGLLAGSKGQPCSISQGSGMLCGDSFRACCGNVQVKKNKTAVAEKSTVAPTKIPNCSTSKCEHECAVSGNNGLVCKCRSGYQLRNDQYSCEDIDECKTSVSSCDEGTICQNQIGSYICVKKPETKEKPCKSGFVRQKGLCIDEDECQTGSAACGEELCLNAEGFYGCFAECPFGYNARGRICEDIDECATNSRLCGSNFKCVNTIGYYKCELASCQTGYVLKDGKCEDIDECALRKHSCGNNYRCENTNGYFKCVLSSCNTGFYFANGRCSDVNECNVTPNICGNGRCYNNYGSYSCSCFTGFHLQADTKSCKDIDECKRSPGICESECVNTIGSFTCTCPRGYQSVADHCEDIDECASSTKRCPADHVCYNEYGNYSCIKTACPSKYYILRSSYECRLLCPGNIGECSEMITQSIKWRAVKFRKFVNPRAYKFTYILRVSSYLRVQINFNLKSGNENKDFFLQRVDENTVELINIKKLYGPRRYTLRIEADVVFRGKVTNKFVYFVYLFVSKYSF